MRRGVSLAHALGPAPLSGDRAACRVSALRAAVADALHLTLVSEVRVHIHIESMGYTEAAILEISPLTSHNSGMKREDALIRLRSAESSIRARGVEHLYIFGSVVRGDAESDSDVDLFIDRDPQVPMGLMGLASLNHLLEDVLGTSVDVGTRGSLHPLVRAEVEQQAVQVF